MLMDLINQYYGSSYTTKSYLFIQWNPHENSNDIIHRDGNLNPKAHKELQMVTTSQSNAEQNE
jgi:hypothetical protein